MSRSGVRISSPALRSLTWAYHRKGSPGDREGRRQLRLALSRNGLAATGELYDRACVHPRELLTPVAAARYAFNVLLCNAASLTLGPATLVT